VKSKRRTPSQEDYSLTDEDSLVQVADKLVGSASELMGTAETEEDLKISFEKSRD
jgi:hypothetical protein